MKKDTRESKETVISYIVNIVSLILVMLVFRFKLLSFSLINLVKQVIFRAVQFILETYFKELLQKLLMLVLDQHL